MKKRSILFLNLLATTIVLQSAYAGSIAIGQNCTINSGGQPYGTFGCSQITGPGGVGTLAPATATAPGKDAIAIGYRANATTDNSIALGAYATTGAVVPTSSTVILGKTYQFAGTAPIGTVSVGSEGQERTITNVAAGRISATSTDAINGSQLYATNQAIESLTNISNVTNQAIENLTTQTVNMQTQINQNTSDITSLKDKIHRNEHKANAGTASAIAVANLPQPTEADKNMVAVAIGTYDGETGYAIGVSRVTENNRWVVKASVTGNSRNKFGAGASAGYQW